MEQQLLLKSSQNLTEMIKLLKLHEETISRLSRARTTTDSQIVDLRWYINGATSDNYGAGYSGNVGGHKTMEAFVIFALSANDTVGVYNINSGTRCCDVHNTFMGYLIGG